MHIDVIRGKKGRGWKRGREGDNSGKGMGEGGGDSLRIPLRGEG